MVRSAVTDTSCPQNNHPSGPSLGIKMSVPESEGDQDHDDILIPGGRVQDP
jgi:hypothetical protein